MPTCPPRAQVAPASAVAADPVPADPVPADPVPADTGPAAKATAVSASGTLASAASSTPEDQDAPSSLVLASGENTRSWLGRKPASTDCPPRLASVRPPLLATPGGVTDARPTTRPGARTAAR